MDVADNQYEASQVLGSGVAAAIEPLNHGSMVRRRCPSRLLTPDGATLGLHTGHGFYSISAAPLSQPRQLTPPPEVTLPMYM